MLLILFAIVVVALLVQLGWRKALILGAILAFLALSFIGYQAYSAEKNSDSLAAKCSDDPKVPATDCQNGLVTCPTGTIYEIAKGCVDPDNF